MVRKVGETLLKIFLVPTNSVALLHNTKLHSTHSHFFLLFHKKSTNKNAHLPPSTNSFISSDNLDFQSQIGMGILYTFVQFMA